MAVVLSLYYLLIYYYGREQYLDSMAVGYSCVVFGWLTILSQISAQNYITIFNLQIPLSLAPFGSLIFTQILIPQASFIGHLSGIIIGYLISWNLFWWFDNTLFYTCFTWTLIGFIYSIKTNSKFDISFIQMESTIRILDNSIEIGGLPNFVEDV